MRRIVATLFIGAQESAYRDSPIGKLEKISLVRTVNSPLQQGFYGNRQTGFPITIDDLPAILTFEQTVVGGMTFPNSTAAGTPFRGMPTINNVQINITVEAPLFEDLPKLEERDSHNGFIEFLSFRLELFEFFDGDVSVEFQGEFDDFPNHLTEVGFDEIPFFVFQPFEFFFGFQTLKQSATSHQFLSFGPNMLSEIGLKQDFAFWRQNGNREVLCIDVDSKNILPKRNLLFLGKESNEFQFGSKTECLASPAFANEGVEALEVPVPLDWNRNPICRITSEFDEIFGFGFECFAVPRNIEFDGNCLDFISFSSNDIPFDVADYLRIEGGFCFAS
jgi:hypothetical protein